MHVSPFACPSDFAWSFARMMPKLIAIFSPAFYYHIRCDFMLIIKGKRGRRIGQKLFIKENNISSAERFQQEYVR